MDVTEKMNAYRECARGLWNTFLRRESGGEGDFDAVDRFGRIRELLFEELVLGPLGKEGFARTRSRDPYPFLTLRPRSEPVRLLINRPSSDGNMYWDDPVRSLEASGRTLHFIEYFDWDVFGYLDFQYYRLQIAECSEHPHLVGRQALMDVRYAAVEFIDQPEVSPA